MDLFYGAMMLRKSIPFSSTGKGFGADLDLADDEGIRFADGEGKSVNPHLGEAGIGDVPSDGLPFAAAVQALPCGGLDGPAAVRVGHFVHEIHARITYLGVEWAELLTLHGLMLGSEPGAIVSPRQSERIPTNPKMIVPTLPRERISKRRSIYRRLKRLLRAIAKLLF